jgi:hypothetical protein
MAQARRGSVVVCLLALLVCASTGAAAAGGTALASRQQATDIDPDGVLMEIDVQEDGSATWRVEYRIRLDDQNTTDAFDSIQDDIRTNRSATEAQFRTRMERTVASAANQTGRSMAVENVSVTTSRRQLPQEYGVMSYQFEWIGFAAVDGADIRAGDALAALFLDEETTLLIAWPEGWALDSASPQPDETRQRAVVWQGPRDFAPSEPRIVLGEAPATTTTQVPGTTPGANDESGGFLSSPVLPAALLGLLAAAVFTMWRRRDGSAESGTADSSPDPNSELLSNEERVLALLEDSGGRIKQQEVQQEFDWTAAKTSQVVKKLREDDEIDVFRLGRENVLTLPDEGPPGEGE